MRLLSSFLIVVLLAGCGGCVPPYIPPRPTPPPTPPPDPLPIPSQLTRADFSSVTVGASFDLGDLPPPDATVTVGGRTIRSWTLSETRPGGGNVRYEIHTTTADNIVSRSFAW